MEGSVDPYAIYTDDHVDIDTTIVDTIDPADTLIDPPEIADGDIHEDLNFWQRAILYMDPGGRTTKNYVGDLVGRLPGAFEDHRMTSYLAKLERHAEATSIA